MNHFTSNSKSPKAWTLFTPFSGLEHKKEKVNKHNLNQWQASRAIFTCFVLLLDLRKARFYTSYFVIFIFVFLINKSSATDNKFEVLNFTVKFVK